MVVAFVGGGTLGHIYPALSIIQKLKIHDPKIKIIFITTKKDEIYISSIKNQIDNIYYIESYGMTKNIFKLIKRIYINIKAYYKIKNIIKYHNVDCVIGMGGYISTISILSSIRLNKKSIIHEQNSIMGLGNKIVQKKVDLVLTSFKETTTKNSNTIWVGNPRYEDTYIKNRKTNNKCILVTSGTLGSYYINNIIVDFLNHPDSKKYTTILITGKRYYEDIVKKVDSGVHYQILPFSNNMVDLLTKSSIVISRSGATTMYEILGSKAIPIYIPSPNVTNNHQYYNAKQFIDYHLGYMIEEKEFNLSTLLNVLNTINKEYDEIQKNIEDYCGNLNEVNITNLIVNMIGDNNDR